MTAVRLDGPPPRGTRSPLTLEALRDEVVAFQVLVDATAAPLDGVTVDVTLDPPPGARGAPLAIDRFVEHALPVTTRSHGKDARDTLAWSAQARPDDADVQGLVPDALVPVALAKPWCRYPLAAAPGRRAALWIDVAVPADAAAGLHRATLCGIDDATDALWCWGGAGAGSLGNDTFDDTATPVNPNGGGAWQSVGAGIDHVCAVKTSGALYCWGHNPCGQLVGAQPGDVIPHPQQVGAAMDWRDIAAGAEHACAIKQDGTLWCWGHDDCGQLGDGHGPTLVPTRIADGL